MNERSLEVQRAEFKQNRFLAMPIAGLIAWTLIGVSGLLFSPFVTVWVIYIGTGSIVYLGMFLSKYTGENFLDKTKPKNTFDTLFFYCTAMALLVYAIAIPFFLEEPTSLPMTVGILTGLMWLPFSWIIEHWVGLFHSIVRTVAIVFTWFLLPDLRFVAIPFLIVIIYIVTILILENRYQSVSETKKVA